MKNIQTLSLYFLFAAALFQGCGDDPGILGSGQISPLDTLSLYSTRVDPTSDTSFIYRFSGFSHLMAGRYLNEGKTIEAAGLLQFSGLTSIPDSAEIDTAYISIQINYAAPDSVGELLLGLYEMSRSWSQSSFTWDSLESSYDPSIKYQHQETFNGLKKIEIRIDSLAKKWVENSTDRPDGLLLKPGLTGNTLIAGSVLGITPYDYPILTVAYHVGLDTIKHFSTYAAQIAYVSSYVPENAFPATDTTIMVQGGISSRGRVQFDLSSLPRGIGITRAILELTPDTTRQGALRHLKDSLLIHLLRKDYYPFDSTALGTICSPAYSDGRKVYRADIKSIVQSWLVREPNHGLLIRPYSESYSFDYFAIFNSRAEFKPKLSIIYTKLP